ncbi:MAG: hypothetical protein AB1486_33635, partial [Planctomycetota bacterium]
MPAPAQDPPDAFWLNKGDPANPHRPELGEFHPGLGGYIEFGRFEYPHPYWQLKEGIKRNFLDLEELANVLGEPVADPVHEELGPPGTVNSWIDLTLAPENKGPFGAGVFGIRIDDIDGDVPAGGYPEIWVSDARGYLHALWRNTDTGRWECFYRTRGLGMYAGI